MQAHAENAPAEVGSLRLEADADGVYLTTGVKFELSAIVEDALLKGIPMFFVAEADVLRDRWYWYDKRVASVARHMRLAYQPLTRGWRLNVSPNVITNVGLGVTLNQNFDSLADALAAVQRISHWKIAEASDIDADARYNVEFRFRLDVSQLPRPFQIGAVGQADWTISASRNQRLMLENAK
ncbi:MAG: DUF4390 domain-containing protein [Rhodoferax sp.]